MLKIHYKEIFDNQDKLWWYSGMAEINKSLLNHYLPRRKNLKVLDAGCGPGANMLYLKRYGKVIGVDLSEEALVFAKKRGRAIRGDVTKLKFKDNTFDLVISTDVLYHMWVKDVSVALLEFKRILKKDGLLLLREPAYNWMRGNQDEVSLTARRFTKKDFKKSLRAIHFKILNLSYANFFLFPTVFLVRLATRLGLKKEKSDMEVPPFLINQFLSAILKLEVGLIKHVSLPFGSSLVCIAKK